MDLGGGVRRFCFVNYSIAGSLPVECITIYFIWDWCIDITSVTGTLFFRISRITNYVAKLFSSTRIQQWLQGPSQFERKTLLTLLGLSLLRYIVFLLQYGIALHLFGVLLNPMQIISAVSVCFLVLAVVPTFAIAELGMRGLIGIWVIGIYSSNTAGILLAAFSLWVVNLILPAAMGALLLLGVQKFFRNE